MSKYLGVITSVAIQHPQNQVKDVVAEVTIKIVAPPSEQLTKILNDLKSATYLDYPNESLKKVAINIEPTPVKRSKNIN